MNSHIDPARSESSQSSDRRSGRASASTVTARTFYPNSRQQVGSSSGTANFETDSPFATTLRVDPPMYTVSDDYIGSIPQYETTRNLRDVVFEEAELVRSGSQHVWTEPDVDRTTPAGRKQYRQWEESIMRALMARPLKQRGTTSELYSMTAEENDFGIAFTVSGQHSKDAVLLEGLVAISSLPELEDVEVKLQQDPDTAFVRNSWILARQASQSTGAAEDTLSMRLYVISRQEAVQYSEQGMYSLPWFNFDDLGDER